MKGTLIDTTSLITLSSNKPEKNEFNRYPSSITFSENTQLSGIEAILLSSNIIIDFPSFKRNLKRFPELKILEKHAEFINVNEKDEDNRYENCVETIVPHMSRPDRYLIDVYRRHIDFLDYCELSPNRVQYYPSTYWEDLTGRLSKGENNLVKALENKFGKNTPFSGAALTNLIRFLYYSASQDVFKCNLSLHFVKSYFMTDFNQESYYTDEKIAKNIIDVFDKKCVNNYNNNFKKWIGVKNPELKIPLLTKFFNKNRNTSRTTIEDLLELREADLCKNFRAAIGQLQKAISENDTFSVNEILLGIENYTNEVLKGEAENPSKNKQKIGISIPFVGGLGTEIETSIPKLNKSPKDNILTFLHKSIQ